MSFLDDLAPQFLPTDDDRARMQALLLRAAVGGESGATAFLEACRLLGEAASDSTGLIASIDAADDRTLIDRIGGLVISCFASIQQNYPSRPDAQSARTALSARADAVVDEAGATFGADLHAWLIRLVGEAIVQISAIAASRAPLVRVETGISLPSSLIAYDLYADPARGSELVERNRTGTPFVMPVVLEALSS